LLYNIEIGQFINRRPTMIVDESEVYTPQEAISILKISDSTFRRLIRKGVLRAAKIGGQYRILGKHILQLLSPTLPDKVKKVYKKVVEELE
jgi:excisionase family DNA binding protein